MIRTRLLLAGSAFGAVLSAQSLALAADVYYDTVGGDDAKDGTTEATAKKTIKFSAGSVIHIKRGSSYTGDLRLSNATVMTYGCGPRVIINGAANLTNSNVEGLHIKPVTGSAFNLQAGNTVTDCEADGSDCTASAMGFMVMGENNKIFSNYVHDFSVSQSGSTVNNSGGAEGIMVMASNNEIAYNSVVNCQSINTTLHGFEGGCYEIVNGKGASQAIHNVSFHHNYCERSVGLFEGCSGNYSATAGGVMENHGVIENVTVSYNVSVDAMWLFLLQTVNTDFKNVIFAHNTLVHTPKSLEWFDKDHVQMALAYDSDTSTGTTIKADNQYYKQGSGFQPGTVAMRNNIFIDDVGSSRNVMFAVNMSDHSNNIFVPANAQVSFAFGGSTGLTLDSTETKIDLATLGLSPDYQLTSASTAAIDKGMALSMSTNAAMAATALNAPLFANVFNQDVARQTVPCGAAPDIGASEFCGGVPLVWPGPSDANSCPGQVTTPSAAGASGTGGGGSTSAGGRPAVGGAAPTASGGAANIGAGGRVTAGGRGAVTAGRAGVAGAATAKTGGNGPTSNVTQPSSNPTPINSTGGQGLGASPVGTPPGTSHVGGQGVAPVPNGTTVTTNGQVTGGSGNNGAVSQAATAAAGQSSVGEQPGCSCRVVGERNSGLGNWVLGAVGLLALRLTRRRVMAQRRWS